MANLANIIPAIFTGPNGQRLTPEQIAERQQLAQSLTAQATDTSPNAGGVASILAKGVQGFAAGRSRNQADASAGANAKASTANVASLLGLLGGGSAAPVDQGSTVASPMVTPVQSVAPATNWDASSVNPALKTGIQETASALGIDPVDLATAISYETGGTFDPTKAGPTTQWGQHKGLIQFGEPQAQKYGVNWEDPIGSQLGPNGAVANYLRDTGVQPGMGLMDIYSAINAGGVGRNNRSDANNGGAPGTVADKVNQQMGGHRAKALALFGGGQSAPASASPMQQAPMQSAQSAPSGINPAIVEALSSPYASEQERSVAGLLLNQQLAQQEAAKKLAAAQAQQAAEWRRQDAIRAQDRNFSLEDRDFAANRQDTRWGVEDKRDNRDFTYRAQNDATSRTREDAKRAEDRLYSVEDRNFSADRQDRRFETEDERANREYNYRVQNDSRNRQATINQQDRDYAYRVENDAANRQAPTSNMREYEAYATDERMAGRQPVGRLQYEQSLRKSGANNTNISLNGEKFDEKFGELDAKALSDTSTAGQAAQRNIGRIKQLGELLKSSPNGWQGAFAQKAGEWGIKTEGLDTLQAAQAAINSLVPEQRQPGSGPMSDADLALFKQSLPRIINQPGGNDIILNTMNSIAQYDAEGANIVQQLRSGKLDRAKAFEALQNRVNPLDSFKAPGAPAENPMPSQQTSTGWKDLGNGVKIRPKGSN